MSQVIRKVQTVLPQAGSMFRASPLTQHSVWGGTVTINHRQYKGQPTHGIGKWKHFAPKAPSKRKKDQNQMKPIVAATDTSYGTLNVKVSGYDMTLVEHYSQYIHKFCNTLGVKVSESYALPTKNIEVFLLPDQGTKMLVDSMLKTHKRVVEVNSMTTSLFPVFLDVLLKNQPEGVELSINEHSEADFQARFKARPEMEGLLARMGQ